MPGRINRPIGKPNPDARSGGAGWPTTSFQSQFEFGANRNTGFDSNINRNPNGDPNSDTNAHTNSDSNPNS